jgi:hypothetical protein
LAHPLLIPFKTQKNELLVHFNEIFTVLHLMYEDLKLNRLVEVESPRLAKLLFRIALAVDPQRKAGYIEYYVRENKETLGNATCEGEIKRAFKDGHAFREGVEVEPVPRIFKWLEECISGS